jgi:uncharacterized phage protein gp47/JayE
MAAETPFDAKTFDQLLKDLRTAVSQEAADVDLSEGSVTRTLLEAFAHELAVSYEQLRQVYRAGFLDTAEDSALDQVVALLGVERRQGGYLEGQVLFSRQQPADQVIAIPSGIRLTGPPAPDNKPCPVVETTGPELLLEVGSTSVLMPVRSLEPQPATDKETPQLEAGRISLMVQPILGIDAISNPAPLQVRQQRETDEELRQRARSWMDRVNLGTVAALEAAVREQGVTTVSVLEPVDQPGCVRVVVDLRTDQGQDHPQWLERVKDAVERTRPAGIRVDILDAQPVNIAIHATLVLRDNLEASQQASLLSQLRQSIADTISGLAIGEPVRASRIRSLLTAPAAVSHLLEPKASDGPSALLWPTPGESTGQQIQEELIRARYLDPNNGDVRLNTTERALFSLDQACLTLLPPVVAVLLDFTLTANATTVNNQMESNTLQAKLDQEFPRDEPNLMTSRKISTATLLGKLGFAPDSQKNQVPGLQTLRLICPPLQIAQTLVEAGTILLDNVQLEANEQFQVGEIRTASAS